MLLTLRPGMTDGRHHAVDAASRTHSDRVRKQLGVLYPYTVGRDANRNLREVRDTIRALLTGQ